MNISCMFRVVVFICPHLISESRKFLECYNESLDYFCFADEYAPYLEGHLSGHINVVSWKLCHILLHLSQMII